MNLRFLLRAFIVSLFVLFVLPQKTKAVVPNLSYLSSVADSGSYYLDAPRSVKIQGNYAYVLAGNEAAITIFDISNPSSPSKVGEIRDTTNLTSKRYLEVSGNYMYAGGTGTGLIVSYDISNKSAPVLADTVTATNAFWDFQISGNYIYAFGNTATVCFTVLDISNPLNMTEVTTATHASRCSGNLGGDISGNYIYSASSSGSDEYLTIFDISTPSSPSFVGSLSFLSAGYSDMNCQDLEYYDGYVYASCYNFDALFSINVTTPSSPSIADVITNSTYMDIGIYVERSGTYMIVGGYQSRSLAVIDVSNPNDLTLHGGLIDTTNLYNIYDFSVSGEYVYVPALTSDRFSIFTFDSVVPSISITPINPDPVIDNTPSLSGTATDSFATVTNVQFQVDSTSGSWSSCNADDGTFDETTENFTCTTASLADGNHTIYVRSTDSNNNTTSTSNLSSDSFTINTSTLTFQNITVSKTESEATITYATYRDASTQMEYGTTSTYGNTTTLADTSPKVSNHTISISGLSKCTWYSFRLLGTDSTDASISSSEQTLETSGCTSTNQSEAPQIQQSGTDDAGGLMTPIKDSDTGGQQAFVIIEPKTINFDAYLSAGKMNPSQIIRPELITNAILVGGQNGLLGIRINRIISWQVGNVQQMWYKTYPPKGSSTSAAKIIPELQNKPSIIALTYKDSDLIPPGQPKIKFSAGRLKLAHSTDGVTWRILPTSVVDTKTKTVAALHKVYGYYMIVGR